MVRLFAVLALSGAFAVAAADAVTQTNLKIYPSGYWFYRTESMDASIIDVNGDTTTFALCHPKSNSTELPSDLERETTLTYGPTMMELTEIESAETMLADFDSTFVYNPHCTRVKTEGSPDTVTCTIEMTGELSGVLVSSTDSVLFSKYLTSSMNIAITAGASKLKGQGATNTGASTTATETTIATSPSSTSVVPKTTDSITKSSSSRPSSASEVESTASEATSTASSSENAARPIKTQNAALVGMAVVGGAALLF
ncbi:hypothetical protein G7Z17_g2382 [Cylindrodendrum hubeiense]|uniref:Uncharacterized protein n=1 Tax=Cylindrodendrum hubeiense TaxID=595255 RepID=A0A9P5LKE2_9HYPO|nr:hypothetical protein G7Z17_g2382 [Cylindrodendrum hubeiense]